ARRGRQAADICLGLVEELDARECLGGDRCITAHVEFVELAPQVAPTISEGYRPAGARRCRQLLVDDISVDLENAVEPLQQFDGMLAAAATRVGVGHSGWITPAPRP